MKKEIKANNVFERTAVSRAEALANAAQNLARTAEQIARLRAEPVLPARYQHLLNASHHISESYLVSDDDHVLFDGQRAVFASARDVTERRRAQEVCQAAVAAVGALGPGVRRRAARGAAPGPARARRGPAGVSASAAMA